MTTDTSESGLERLICTALTGDPCEPPKADSARELVGRYDGFSWSCGSWLDYDREYCLDQVQLIAFLKVTQPMEALALGVLEDGPAWRRFLARLQGEISKRGTIDVLRHGVSHGPLDLRLFYGSPSEGNETARERFDQNRFTVTRQLRYSRDETQLALDIALFINGLPVFTFELKNNLTKQTVDDAVRQYQRDRDPREKLFAFGRCIAHFAVDESEVRFCTHLTGKDSWFLPFNRGWNDGAGNPPNPSGIKTDYLWREILGRESVTGILENYAQIVVTKDKRTGKKRKVQIWPRYHQLDVVRRLLADVQARGAGRKYLIQHSAGSGKSNSIAWLAHQLIGLARDGADVFDSIVVVTDRRILDRQIGDTIGHYAQVRATVGKASRAGDLRRFIESGRKIIVSTVQKFPFILDEIGDSQRNRRFAIVIDEAHSSQGGKTSAAMSKALSEAGGSEEDETYEDRINRIMESRKLLPNASYFAFTATPKNKTLELFGEPDPQTDGRVKHRAFHDYTMKQAIDEGFIIDVVRHFTPIASYYRLAKTVEDDPEFDTRKARRKLRRFVEGHDHAIRLKAEIMVDHFHEQVLSRNRIGGQARAMVVTDGVKRAIRYFHTISEYLRERKSPHKAIVAFSGEHEYGGAEVTEASLNGFASRDIADRIREDPYRFLVCADKFQTGYDEPLLHTMYVDKTLSGIKAVQTLSRLNRSHPKKHDAFVLDFQNEADTIREAFADYYRATVLADETDPNKLHDLQAELDGARVYTESQISDLVRRFVMGEERDRLDPILDACVAVYQSDLDEDGQVAFKGNAKAFVRTYGFLSSVLPYTRKAWEERSIFLDFLIPKLPSPKEDDLSRGILEAIDMDSYRVEKQAVQEILLADEDAELDPVPTAGGGGKPELEIDRLSNILKVFNEQFGDIAWEDADRVRQMITETIPSRVAEDRAFRNARQNSDKDNARVEHDMALRRVMRSMMKDDGELLRQFLDNDGFRRWMTDTVFDLTYDQPAAG